MANKYWKCNDCDKIYLGEQEALECENKHEKEGEEQLNDLNQNKGGGDGK